MRVELWLHSASQPLIFRKALTTYQKGSFFCITVGSNLQDRKTQNVYKYPLTNVFRVKESV